MSDLHNALEVMDRLPPGFLQWLREAAAKLGVPLISIITFLFTHQEIIAGLVADWQAKNYAKLVADLVAAYQAWQASQTPAPSV